MGAVALGAVASERMSFGQRRFRLDSVESGQFAPQVVGDVDAVGKRLLVAGAGAITGDVGSGFGVWAMLMRKVRRSG